MAHIVFLISRLPDIVQKCFVLQMELWIPSFKCECGMSQPSSMFIAGEIIEMPSVTPCISKRIICLYVLGVKTSTV